MKQEAKTSTVFIRGLSGTINDEELHDVFKDCGKIRQAFVTKCKGQFATNNQIGYVKFTSIDEATKAIDTISSIGEQKITLMYARKKPRKYRKPLKEESQEKRDSGLSDTEDENEEVEKKKKSAPAKSKPKATKNVKPDDKTLKTVETKSKSSNDSNKLPKNKNTIYIKNLSDGLTDKDVRKKCRKIGPIESITMDGNSAAVTFKENESAKNAIKKLNNHVYKQQVITVVSAMISDKALKKISTPSRIIIRNLSFKVTEELLQSELIKFGNPIDLSIPKNEAGKMKGFAFVSFSNKFEANKALQKLNGKEILKRKVAVDWAVPKEQHSKNVNAKQKPTEESRVDSDEGDEDEEEVDDEEEHNDEGDGASTDEDAENSDEEVKPPKREYDDVKEGRTIFLGNLPFDVEKEDIEETFSSFGAIRYVRMVYDHEKDRAKGIAFLQFSEKISADACLERATANPICIGGRALVINRAVDKKDANVKDITSASESVGKNNRNLHLAMEGVIKEGTNAATGVSKTDMMKRKLALEAKKKKLKNVNFFVSTTRLCIRNMPPKFNEMALKKLMSKYGHVSQVKIMRDVKHANSDGVGKSKGYGFVQFSKPDTALAALRAVNNNPNVFTELKRPIVDFSIENKSILTAREKKFTVKPRDSDSSVKPNKKSFNQRWKESRVKKKQSPKKSDVNSEASKDKKLDSQVSHSPVMKAKKRSKNKVNTDSNAQPKQSTDKISVTESSHQKSQASDVKQHKRSNKNGSERPNKKQKRNTGENDEAKFQKLVENYKQKLVSDESTRSFKKWYED